MPAPAAGSRSTPTPDTPTRSSPACAGTPPAPAATGRAGTRTCAATPVSSPATPPATDSDPPRGGGRFSLVRRRAARGRPFVQLRRSVLGSPALVVVRVDLRVFGPLGRQLVLGEAGVDRAGLDAGVAVDALIGIDVEHLDRVVVGLVGRRVDAVDRAYLDARVVLGADARLGYDVGHSESSPKSISVPGAEANGPHLKRAPILGIKAASGVIRVVAAMKAPKGETRRCCC